MEPWSIHSVNYFRGWHLGYIVHEVINAILLYLYMQTCNINSSFFHNIQYLFGDMELGQRLEWDDYMHTWNFSQLFSEVSIL